MNRGPGYNNDLYYHSKWKKIVNVMSHSNLSVSRIAPAGSRTKRKHRIDSDMDVIFAVARNPSHEEFYPNLIYTLESNFPHDKVYPGRDYNVVHFDFSSGGKFDLVLLTEKSFDGEYESIKNYKRENL